ncbi:MAG: hypothetical protein U0798_03350 [Gemmataceae bacterium]
MKKYIVRLSAEERATLRDSTPEGFGDEGPPGQILLKADADGPNWTDARIVEAFSCRRQTVGAKTIGNGRVRGGVERKEETAEVDETRWGAGGESDCDAVGATAGGLCELDAETVGRSGGRVGDRRFDQLRDGASDAQKNGFTAKKIEYWVIPPAADSEFVAGMEDVLDVYAEPVDSQVPVVCMDEQPVQLLNETRKPIPATREHPKRIDYEYERAGTASVFVFCEPKSGWRRVTVRPRRTKSVRPVRSKPSCGPDTRRPARSCSSATTSTRMKRCLLRCVQSGDGPSVGEED